jgi:hypothetical protein
MCTFEKLKKKRDQLLTSSDQIRFVILGIPVSKGINLGCSELVDRQGQQYRASLQKADLLDGELRELMCFMDKVRTRLDEEAGTIQTKLNDVEIMLKEVA